MCKKIILFFIVFTVCFLGMNIVCLASKQEEMFLTANNLYEQKKYKQALDLYKKIEKKDSALLYNIGNCEFCLGHYVAAIIAWNKSKKGAALGNLNDINHNISVAYDKLGISHEVSFWQEMKDIINSFFLFYLQLLFLIFWFLFFLVFMFIKKLRGLFLGFTLSLSFIFLSIVVIKYRLIRREEAIVTSATSFFAGPNEKYHKLGDLSVADKIIVQKKEKKWYKIDHDGVVGWVLIDHVEKV